jgi:aspartate kinase
MLLRQNEYSSTKFGGTSVADVDCIKKVAKRVKRSWAEGNQVVVVVSARAGVTNQLIERANAILKNPTEREMDVLMTCGEQETIALMALALHALKVPAVSRTGWQSEIVTEGIHTKSRIREVKGGDIRKQLKMGNVVVVAGFQGVSDHGDVTTFGRGGSDLSAIALAGALRAKNCQIFTDVEGFTLQTPELYQMLVRYLKLTTRKCSN